MKLFSTIVDSTIWREEAYVKVVWVTMLAKADRNGYVFVSVPGLADAARVTLEQCVDSIAKLSAPDQWSRTKTNEGRRIREIDGGFELLNYLKYRELRSEEERRLQTREAVARHRVKKAKALTVSTVSQGKPGKAHAEADPIGRSKEDQIPPGGEPLARSTDLIADFCDRWKAKHGRNYEVQGKDAGLVSKLKGTRERWGEVVDRYLADTDRWLVQRGHTIADLVSTFNAYTGPKVVALAKVGKFQTKEQIQAEASQRFLERHKENT